MSDYQLFRDEGLIAAAGPATHAIVIGVGAYPHLHGGSGALVDLNGGLKQLSSPPVSAREFSDWLLDEFNNPDKPLASVSMLVSEADAPQPYTHTKLTTPFTPQIANSGHVKKAIREWKQLGDLNEDNLIIFFFCGHGVAGGLDQMTLLLADYGEDNDMPMDGAIDFSALRRGMSQCKASQQCFFIDACRTLTDIATRTTATGQKIIQDNIVRPHASDWNVAVIYSTLGGEKAYGRKHKPSFYTEELITGLNGAGSNKRNGQGVWRVSVGDLHAAVHHGLSLRGPKLKPPVIDGSSFEFHQLKQTPIVPITVYCSNETDTHQAVFKCLKSGQVVKNRQPAEEKWITELPFGFYDFQAEINTRKGQRAGEVIMPPYQDIQINVDAET